LPPAERASSKTPASFAAAWPKRRRQGRSGHLEFGTASSPVSFFQPAAKKMAPPARVVIAEARTWKRHDLWFKMTFSRKTAFSNNIHIFDEDCLEDPPILELVRQLFQNGNIFTK
jgi:hypothetical protein